LLLLQIACHLFFASKLIADSFSDSNLMGTSNYFLRVNNAVNGISSGGKSPDLLCSLGVYALGDLGKILVEK
jgi:hypothetical protein